jgi:hypothetical protein
MADPSLEIIGVNGNNVATTGFFCGMSKPKSEGYRQKLEWLKDRFAEGLKIKMIARGGRGFIEYILRLLSSSPGLRNFEIRSWCFSQSTTAQNQA